MHHDVVYFIVNRSSALCACFKKMEGDFYEEGIYQKSFAANNSVVVSICLSGLRWDRAAY